MVKAKSTVAIETKVEKEAVEAIGKTSDPIFPKIEILKSNQFNHLEKDFLHAFLAEENYSIQEARTILDNKLKGVVN